MSNKLDKLVGKILNEEINKKVDSIVEALYGNQSELDVAKPKGRLTAADFKKIRQSRKEEKDKISDIVGKKKSSYKKYMDEELEEGKEVCSECGNTLYEGECMECGWKGGEMDEEEDDIRTDDSQKDDSMVDAIMSHLVHHDKPSKPGEKWHDFFTKGPLVDYIKNKKGNKKETDEEMEEGNKFSGELDKARRQHKDRFEVDGKTYPVREGKEKWIQKTKMHKGALHKKLGVPEDDKIPVAKLKSLKKELEAKGKGDKKMSASDLKLLKQVNLALNLKSLKEEKNNLTLTENELIDMIENIIMEQKKKKEEDVKVSKVVNKVKDTINKKYVSGLAKTEKAHLNPSKKENDDYIQSVTKKMKEYLKNGSDGEFEMNPKMFPKGNGQFVKDDTKAYHPSDAVDEYIEAFSFPGQTNLVYGEIKPEDEKMEMYLKGNSKTGNAVTDESGKALGNVVPSKVGEKFMKNYEDNLYGAEQMEVSYKRYPQDTIDVAGEKTKSGSLKSKAAKAQKILNNVTESDSRKEKVISEEMNKMKNLISYNKKTQ